MGVCTQVFMIFVFISFCFGVYDYLTSYEENKCSMTYMYEYPKYTKVKMDKEVQKQYPYYKLYFYGEGQYAVKYSNMKLEGIPVLFIPGNAGSYKQVRSLASVALRKSMKPGVDVHFNFFSVDYDDELSALNGALLSVQTEFAAQAIICILDLYQFSSHPPSSVIIVGHSMGGIISRALFNVEGFQPSWVETIITQATPHQYPVVMLDSYTSKFYEEVNSLWRREMNSTLSHVAVVSTSGGPRDLLVRGDLTQLTNLVHPDRSISTSTLMLPGAWLSTDHLCHVWCKQVVLATARALYDMVDKSTKQMYSDVYKRMDILNYHFSNEQGSIRTKVHFNEEKIIEASMHAEERPKKSWKLSKDLVEVPLLYSCKVPKLPRAYRFIGIANMSNDDWLVGCTKKKDEAACVSVENYGSRAVRLPPTGKKLVELSVADVAKVSEILVNVDKSIKPVEVTAELFSAADRSLVYNVSRVRDLPWLIYDVIRRKYSKTHEGTTQVVIPQTAADAVYYSILISDMKSPLEAYEVFVDTVWCKPNATGESVIDFKVPWTGERNFFVFEAGSNISFSLKLETGKSPHDMSQGDLPSLNLYLNPACRYRVSMTLDHLGMAGQFVRFYSVYLPVFVVVQIFMILAYQLKMLDEEDHAPSILESHMCYASPLRVIPAALLTTWIFFLPNSPMNGMTMIPQDDRLSLYNLGRWHHSLPLLLYLVAYSIFMVYIYVLSAVVIAIGYMYSYLLSRCIGGSSVRLMSFLIQVCGLATIPVAYYMCGSLAILILYLCYLAKMIWSFVVAVHSPVKTRDVWSEHNVLTTISIILLVQLGLNLPALLTWAHRLQYGQWCLQRDPSQTLGLLTAVSCGILLLTPAIPRTRDWLNLVSYLLHICSPALLVICPATLYVLTTSICLVLKTLVITMLASSLIGPPISIRRQAYDALPRPPRPPPANNGSVHEDDFKQIR